MGIERCMSIWPDFLCLILLQCLTNYQLPVFALWKIVAYDVAFFPGGYADLCGKWNFLVMLQWLFNFFHMWGEFSNFPLPEPLSLSDAEESFSEIFFRKYFGKTWPKIVLRLIPNRSWKVKKSPGLKVYFYLLLLLIKHILILVV